MQSSDAVRAAFTDPDEFWSSPLYRHLSGVVAGDRYLVGLAAHTRDGQVPTFAFFGAVHALLLAGVEHPLADYYPSLRGDGVLPPAGAGPALLSFARRYESAIVDHCLHPAGADEPGTASSGVAARPGRDRTVCRQPTGASA